MFVQEASFYSEAGASTDKLDFEAHPNWDKMMIKTISWCKFQEHVLLGGT